MAPQTNCITNWVMKGLSMSSRVCPTGHIKDPVPLIEKSRASCTGGRFPPSFIPKVIVITGLSIGYTCIGLYVFALKMCNRA